MQENLTPFTVRGYVISFDLKLPFLNDFRGPGDEGAAGGHPSRDGEREGGRPPEQEDILGPPEGPQQ